MTPDEERPSRQHRDSYESYRQAIEDADRVALDLIKQVDGQLLVPADEVIFLARRLRQFTSLIRQTVPGDVI
ncbi:hypothetical protein [Nocardioides bruguierae]|uniref:Uncharacterized protein n=1 Tax=Nocardioides bruguierae TaxID=2945102 RepID=A0A9X2DBF7_9ACTN|nr:hypothetical protein [Nocardioides bruguierae]MCM0622842.1 hypothetical protein [Nocardioides bruguierae]